MDARVRKAVREDAKSIAVISIEVWANAYLRDGINGFFADYVLSEFTENRILERLDDPRSLCWVSDNRDGIDGFIFACEDAVPPADGCSSFEVETLYVQPRHQSAGKGLLLLQQAIGHCRSCSFENLWLKVNAENGKAIGFYRRHGFRNVGSTFFRIGDASYENFVMRLDLSSQPGQPMPSLP
ncbi:N-acetyltransferase family protein [Rhizobium binxianense]